MWKRFLAGSVKFSVNDEGVNLLNRLRKYKLHDIEVGDGFVSFSLSLGHKKAVEHLLGKRTYSAVENKNIFAFVNFFYSRIVLTMTAIICIVAFIILDQYAFHVKLLGIEGEEYTEVSNYLAQHGIHNMVHKKIVKNTDLSWEIVNEFNFISAANVSMKGSTITIRVLRAENVVPYVPDKDIISPANGVIADIVVFSGTAMVTIGDVVRTGDLLVTGNRPTAKITIVNGKEVICVVNNTVVS